MMMSLRKQVLSCLEAQKKISVAQVCKQLGFHPERDKRKIDNCFRQHMLLSRCRRIKPGVYRLVTAPPATPPEQQRKMWRAMWNEKNFTLDQIELLSGPIDRGYLERYVRYTGKQGFVRVAGKTGKVPFYQLTGQATTKVPIYKRPRQRSDRPGWKEEVKKS